MEPPWEPLSQVLTGVLSSESLYETFNGNNLFSFYLVNGIFLPNQLAGIGDEFKRICGRLNKYLISLTVSPGAHHEGKFREGNLLFTGLD